MRKKYLAVAMAAVMAFSSAAVLPGTSVNSNAAGEVGSGAGIEVDATGPAVDGDATGPAVGGDATEAPTEAPTTAPSEDPAASGTPAPTTAASGEMAVPVVKIVDETVGKEDKTEAFWTAFTKDHYEIADGKTITLGFENISDEAEVYHNFAAIFTSRASHNGVEGWGAAGDIEYAVIRADNYGWCVKDGDTGITANTAHAGGAIAYTTDMKDNVLDLDAFKEIMKDANVYLSVARKGKQILMTMEATSVADATKKVTNTATFEIDDEKGGCFMTLTVEKACLKMKSFVDGAKASNVTPLSDTFGSDTEAFWTAFSKDFFKIENGKTTIIDFENTSQMAELYHTYVSIFTNVASRNGDGKWDATKDIEYAVVRADNYGWCVKEGDTGITANTAHGGSAIEYKGGYDGTTITTEDAFKEILKKAHVTMAISRKDDLISMTESVANIDDPTKKYTRTATFKIDKADLDSYIVLTCEKATVKMISTALADMTGEMPAAPGQSTEQPSDPTNGTKKQNNITVTAKVGNKKVTGTITSPDTANPVVKVTVNGKDASSVEVKDKKFTATLSSKLKAGDKVVVTVTAEGFYDKESSVTVKGKITIKSVTAKKNTKKVTGSLSVKKATVKVKVGKKTYKAKVSGTKFTAKTAKLKKGTKVVVTATLKNYTKATKTVKVK